MVWWLIGADQACNERQSAMRRVDWAGHLGHDGCTHLFRPVTDNIGYCLPDHTHTHGTRTLYLLYSGWVRTIYIAGMGVGVARDAVRHVSL